MYQSAIYSVRMHCPSFATDTKLHQPQQLHPQRFVTDDAPPNHDFTPYATDSLVLSLASMATCGWLRDFYGKPTSCLRHWSTAVSHVGLLQSRRSTLPQLRLYCSYREHSDDALHEMRFRLSHNPDRRITIACNGAGGRVGFEINTYLAGPLMRVVRCQNGYA